MKPDESTSGLEIARNARVSRKPGGSDLVEQLGVTIQQLEQLDQGQEGRPRRLPAQAPFHPERYLQIGTALAGEFLSFLNAVAVFRPPNLGLAPQNLLAWM
jgi:hypothetical protein